MYMVTSVVQSMLASSSSNRNTTFSTLQFCKLTTFVTTVASNTTA